MARGSVLITIDSVFGLLTTLLVFRLFATTHGLDALGIWALVLSYTGMLSSADFSGSGALARFVSLARVGSIPGKSPVDFIDTVTILVSGLFLIVAPIAYYPLKLLLYGTIPQEAHSVVSDILAISLATGVIMAVAQTTTSALDGLKRADLRAMIQVFSKVVMIVFAVILIPKYGAFGIAWAKLLEATSLLVVGRVSVHRMFDDVALFPRYFCRQAARESISYGGRLQLNRILNTTFTPLANTLVTQFGGLAAVAVFDLANRSGNRLIGLARNAAMPLVPVFAENADLNPEAGVSLLRKSTDVILHLVFLVMSASVLATPLISWVFLDRVDSSFVLFVAILAPALYVQALAISIDFFARGLGYLRWNILAALITLVSVASFGLGLGTLFGGNGVVVAVAMAIVAGGLTMVIGNLWYFNLRLLDVFHIRVVLLGAAVIAQSIVISVLFV